MSERDPFLDVPPLFAIEGPEPEWTTVDQQFFHERRVQLHWLDRCDFGKWIVYTHNGERKIKRFAGLQWIPVPIAYTQPEGQRTMDYDLPFAALIRQTADSLADLLMVNYRHQIGPRGCSETAGMDDCARALDAFSAQLRLRASDALATRMRDERRRETAARRAAEAGSAR
jgi:hypothetical protein